MATDKELIELFRRAPEVIASAVGNASPEEARFSPVPGKWTIREIAAHLADSEIVGGMRLRQMIGEDLPNLILYKQDEWAKAFAYNEREVAASLGLLRTLRGINADMLDRTSSGAFERQGRHQTRGVITVRDWVDHMVKHVDRHAEQIAAIRVLWEESVATDHA